MNILANAINALEEFHTTRTHQDRPTQPSQIVMRTSFLNRQWAEIAIADNGAGTPKAIQSQIFEPFFTTKPTGKSTRMGISIRHQMIAKKHSGRLICRSVPGQGAEFLIQIPVQQRIYVAS